MGDGNSGGGGDPGWGKWGPWQGMGPLMGDGNPWVSGDPVGGGAPKLSRAPCGGRARGAPTLQQAQYFQHSSSSSARSGRRKRSRGMSHQKDLGGQSVEAGEEEKEGGTAHSPLEPARPPAGPGCQLTLLLVHQDGAVGPGGAVALHRVAVRAVVLFVPEGAVLHHLLCCARGQ